MGSFQGEPVWVLSLDGNLSVRRNHVLMGHWSVQKLLPWMAQSPMGVLLPLYDIITKSMYYLPSWATPYDLLLQLMIFVSNIYDSLEGHIVVLNSTRVYYIASPQNNPFQFSIVWYFEEVRGQCEWNPPQF